MILGKNVAIFEDGPEHIKKHKFEMNHQEMVNTADNWTKGVEGLHACQLFDRELTVVVRGTHEEDGRKYGIVRTILQGKVDDNYAQRTGLKLHSHSWDDDRGFSPLCNKHGTIPYSSGLCSFCEV
tara:strand:- start:4492 stop:4866 length:375 start_codon:yes stop_codon:yes gene_type:complete